MGFPARQKKSPIESAPLRGRAPWGPSVSSYAASSRKAVFQANQWALSLQPPRFACGHRIEPSPAYRSPRGVPQAPPYLSVPAMIRASWLLFSRQYPEEHIENMIWNIKPEIGRNILIAPSAQNETRRLAGLTCSKSCGLTSCQHISVDKYHCTLSVLIFCYLERLQ